jgi:hypothetical protein
VRSTHGENSNNSTDPAFAVLELVDEWVCCCIVRLPITAALLVPGFVARDRSSRRSALASSFSGPGYSSNREQNLRP